MIEWKQEKPEWCPHGDCIFKRRAMDALCAGELPAPVPHDGDFNTHRLCITTGSRIEEVYDLQVNTGDLYHFRRILDAIDGRG